MSPTPSNVPQSIAGLEGLPGAGPVGGANLFDRAHYGLELVWVSNTRGEIVSLDDAEAKFAAEETDALAQDVARRLKRRDSVRFASQTRFGPRLAVAQRLGVGRDALCVGCLLAADAADDDASDAQLTLRAASWAMAHRDGENAKLATRVRHLRSENDALRAAHAETVEAAIREREGRRRATQKQKAFNKLYRAEEAANRAKNLFLATVSHELRTPLTAILGFTDVLLGNLLEPESREAAVIVQRNGEHLLAIINDILDLCKIDAERLQIAPTTCALLPLLEGVMTLMQVRADAKGLPLALECDASLPETIVTDATRLRQILINLIGNAIKFTETGSVRVAARLERRGEDAPMLIVDVVDSGIGMTEEQIARLFQPFAQASAETNARYGGTGLGLAISRRLAKLLGGDIAVRSDLHKGSTFTASLSAGSIVGGQDIRQPEIASPEAIAREPIASAPHELALAGFRVLLVEDGPDNQRLISFVLRKAGATVSVAGHGGEALEAVFPTAPAESDALFDVIVMDLQMPVMDGYEAAAMLRDRGYAGPLIALSAHTSDDAMQRAKTAGFDHYMTKPIERYRLIELVRHCALESQAAGGR